MPKQQPVYLNNPSKNISKTFQDATKHSWYRGAWQICIQNTTMCDKDSFIEFWERTFPLYSNKTYVWIVSSNSKKTEIATKTVKRQQTDWAASHPTPRHTCSKASVRTGKKRASDAFTISGTLHNKNLMQNRVKGCNLYHTWKALYTSSLNTSLSEKRK